MSENKRQQRKQITRDGKIRKDLAVALIKGWRKTVLGDLTDLEIFEELQPKKVVKR